MSQGKFEGKDIQIDPRKQSDWNEKQSNYTLQDIGRSGSLSQL